MRHLLARQDERRWTIGAFQRSNPSFGGFDRVSRTENGQVGDGAQGGQMLHRLVGRSIFAQTNGIVGEDIDDRLVHQRRQAHRRAAIVGKHKERAGIGPDAAMQRHAIHGCGHAMLTHAIVDIAAGVIGGLNRGVIAGAGVYRTGQVRRTAHQSRIFACESFNRLARRGAGGQCRLVFQHGLDVRFQRLYGSQRRLTRQLADEGFKMFRGLQALLPGCARQCAKACGAAPAIIDVIRDHEGLMTPTQRFAGPGNLLSTQRCAVRTCRARLRRRAKPDGGLAGDEDRLVALLGFGECGINGNRVVAIHLHRGPACAFEARAVVHGIRQVRRAVDGDGIVVPQHDQAVQFQVAGQRDRFLADAFLQVAVRGNHPGMVVDQIVAVLGIEHAFSQGHAHSCRDTLTQRTGGGFNARAVAVFRVTGGLCPKLTEVAQLIHRHTFNTDQMEDGVDQHGAMAR